MFGNIGSINAATEKAAEIVIENEANKEKKPFLGGFFNKISDLTKKESINTDLSIITPEEEESNTMVYVVVVVLVLLLGGTAFYFFTKKP